MHGVIQRSIARVIEALKRSVVMMKWVGPSLHRLRNGRQNQKILWACELVACSFSQPLQLGKYIARQVLCFLDVDIVCFIVLLR